MRAAPRTRYNSRAAAQVARATGTRSSVVVFDPHLVGNGMFGGANYQGLRMKTVVIALVCLGTSVGIATLGLSVIAFTAGPSIAAGERAAGIVGGLNLLLWFGAIASFWFLSRSIPLVARILGTLGFGVIACVALGFVFVVALVLLNR
jgi:hypothetical protein